MPSANERTLTSNESLSFPLCRIDGIASFIAGMMEHIRKPCFIRYYVADEQISSLPAVQTLLAYLGKEWAFVTSCRYRLEVGSSTLLPACLFVQSSDQWSFVGYYLVMQVQGFKAYLYLISLVLWFIFFISLLHYLFECSVIR